MLKLFIINTIKDIFIAEFKNLYALEKQFCEAIPAVVENSQNKHLQNRVNKLAKKSEKQMEQIQTLLQKHEINPGNVVDSVAQQIFQNITEISNSELNADVKDVGLWTSLNRLLAYKTACYKNTRELAKSLHMKDLQDELKQTRKFNKKQLEKMDSKVKKKLL